MRILIVSGVDQDVIRHLGKHHEVIYNLDLKPEVLRTKIQGCHALVFRSGVSITADLLACAPELGLLVRAGSGLDNVDLDYVKMRKIKLVRIPQPSAQAVAEMAIALMLSLSRNLREADNLLRQGRWAKHKLESHLVSGKVLGIVGAGNIGTRVGQLGAALGMKPIGCVEKPSPLIANELRQKGIQCASFKDVVSSADYLSIHVPLSDSTHNLINAATFAQMKRGSYLINLARGGVVDEAALYQELVSGARLRGAALDVHAREGEGHISPLAELPNVLLTPHIGAMTVETQQEIGRRAIEIIEAYAETLPKRHAGAVQINSLSGEPGYQFPAMTD